MAIAHHKNKPASSTGTPAEDANAPLKRVGRPKTEASMVLNVRLPLSLIARLDRYLAHLESTTGLKANRGMIARRAVIEFLDNHERKAEQ